MSATKTISKRKATGSHFTPRELAEFLARRLIDVASLDSLESIRVLDPACGDGELLAAFARMLPPALTRKTTLVGFDSDGAALAEARRRLQASPVEPIELTKADFLELGKLRFGQLGLFDDRLTLDSRIDLADIVIANPPYVRTQVLGAEKAQELAAAFDLTGRVDLYHAFLVAMTHCLRADGLLGVITSNRFLTTKGGAAVRAFIARHYDVLEVIDLGDTKLFAAAVLPAILIGRKRAAAQNGHPAVATQFIRIYEDLSGATPNGNLKAADSIYTVLAEARDGQYHVANRRFAVSTGSLLLPASSIEPWRMVTSTERAWLKTIDSHAKLRVGDIAKIRVGIKTTADEVFTRNDWSSLPDNLRPEAQLLRPLLTHDDAGRWIQQIDIGSLRQVLYPHEIKGGKRTVIDLAQYPRAAAYLEQHRPRLERRAYISDAKRHWFEIWVPQDPAAWRRPKVVFPDISAEPRFFYDGQGCIVDGDCYWLALEVNHNPDWLFFIQGLANTRLMTRYHDLAFNNKLYSGRRRYLTQYVEKYPLPDPDNDLSHRIITLVKELVFGRHDAASRAHREQEIETLAEGALGVANSRIKD